MPTELPDLYEVLGLPRTATTAEIHAQYRKLIKKEHPDRFAGERARAASASDSARVLQIDERIAQAEQRSRLLNQAHRILTDPRRREEYDLGGPARQPGRPAPAPSGPPKIVLSTSQIDLGPIARGDAREIKLTIDNRGGMPSQISIDWEIDPSWADPLTVLTDPTNTFPITVRTRVRTSGLDMQFYRARLIIRVDGLTYPVDVNFAVRADSAMRGGQIPIIGVRPGIHPGQPAQLIFSRMSIDFGSGPKNRQLRQVIRINNLGGIPTSLSIDWARPEPWANLQVRPDPISTFPVDVMVQIDTTGLGYGSYRQALVVTLDGKNTVIPVMFEVRDPSAPFYRPPVYSSPSASPSYNTSGCTARIILPLVLIAVVGFCQMINAAFRDNTTSSTAITAGNSRPSSQVSNTGGVAQPKVTPGVPPTSRPPDIWYPVPDTILNDNASWEFSPEPASRGDSVVMEGTDGAFHWVLPPGEQTEWWQMMLPPRDGENVFISTRARLVSGDPVRYGLIFGYRDATHYKMFFINPITSRTYSYVIASQYGTAGWKIKDGNLPHGFNPAGNRLAILLEDGIYTFTIDDVRVYYAGNLTTGGKVGLYARNRAGAASPIELRFDELVIHTP